MPHGGKKKTKPKIRGIVLPEKWNDEGSVISVAIHTDDETAYLVEQNRKGRELLKLIRCKVEAEGKIRERLDGKTILMVREYNTIDESEACFENHAMPV